MVSREPVLLEALTALPEPGWAALIEQALTHGTAGLLFDHLLSFGETFLPEDVAEVCRGYIATCEASFATGLSELGRVIAAFDSAGLEAVSFKGPALAIAAYAKPALRSFRDLDLLIRPAQREAALAVLDRLGYRSAVDDLTAERLRAYHCYNGQDILFAAGRLPVEPHWALAPRTFSADLDVAALMDRAVEIGGLRTLAPEDALLVAALHGAKEEWARLIWVTDVAAILDTWPGLDARVTLDRAAAIGCGRMLLLAVLLARELAGAEPPGLLVERALGDKVMPCLVADIRRRMQHNQGETASIYTLTPFRWRVRERVGDRVRYALRTLLTARVPHFRTVHLPERLAFLYPAVRIGRDALVLPVWKRHRRWGLRGHSGMRPERPSDARFLRFGAHGPKGRSAPMLENTRHLTIPDTFRNDL